MWKCQQCGKPVYFAERRQSLGFDWHPYCLKCEECGKILNPGQHAEHKGVPYCHIPCYGALFGPKLFGHGSTVESHRSFGQRSNSFIRIQTELENKVKEYNRYYVNSPRCGLVSREVNSRLVLEGVLKVYWGVDSSIRLKEFDDNRPFTKDRDRKALSLGYQYEDIVFGNDDNSDDESFTSLPFTPAALDQTLPALESLCLSNHESKQAPDVLKHKVDESKDETNCDIENLSSNLKEETNHVEELIDNNFARTPVDSELTNGMILGSEVSSEAKVMMKQEEIKMRQIYQGGVKEDIKVGRRQSLEGESRFTQVKLCEDEMFLPPKKASTLPSSLTDCKDEIDELLLVERVVNDHDKLYNTVHSFAHLLKDQDCEITPPHVKEETHPCLKLESVFTVPKPQEEEVNEVKTDEPDQEVVVTEVNTYEPNQEVTKLSIQELPKPSDQDSPKLSNQETPAISKPLVEISPYSPSRSKPMMFQLGCYQTKNPPFKKQLLSPSKTATFSKNDFQSLPVTRNFTRNKKPDKPPTIQKSKTRTTIRRTPKKYDKAKLKRRSSVNGHWYDRDTSVFTPPKGSAMSVWGSSLQPTQEVVNALLQKYRVESDPKLFALYVIKESGERRLLGDNEFPLLLRVNLGPHENIAKFYLMDRRATVEIRHEVAQFIRFSYAELRAFLNMFYEEEEREAERIKEKYQLMRLKIMMRIGQLKVKF